MRPQTAYIIHRMIEREGLADMLVGCTCKAT
jgi:hypothetical protein